MKTDGYEIILDDVIKTIKKENYRRIILQLPEGLKPKKDDIIGFLKKNVDVEIILLADPCFGACDIPFFENNNLKIDMILQIGHSEIKNLKKGEIPVFFVNARSDIDITKGFKKAIKHLKGEKIGLLSTSQHVHKLKDIKKILEEENYKTFISKGDKRIKYDGQILGCNFSAAKKISDKVDCFFYVGSGNFHPIGLMLSTDKPVICFDPYIRKTRIKELKELKEMILRQRYGAIARSKDAKNFGILIGIKTGQQRVDIAYDIKKKIELKDKKAVIIALNYFSQENLMGFRDIDCYVSTGCPRIAIDDYMRYKTPILTPVELEILLGYKNWDDYSFDEII